MAAPTILFDLNGTLLDVGVVARPWGEGHAALAHQSLDDAVVSGMVATLTDAHRPFSELLHGALARRARLEGLDEDRLDEAVDMTKRMPAFPEVPAALDDLRAAGARLAVLTNSAAADADEVLGTAGLRDRFALVLGTEEVRAFKPDPRPYRHALDQLGARAGEVTMVAAHWWDVEGAKRAGLRTAWVARREGILRPTVPEPDVCGDDVGQVAAALIGS